MRTKKITPAKIARKPMTHLQPLVKPKKPPVIGPRAGPKNGAAAKRAIPSPRWFASRTSEMTPPALLKGLLPKKPAKNLNTRICAMDCETVTAMSHIVRKKYEITYYVSLRIGGGSDSRIHTKISLRP